MKSQLVFVSAMLFLFVSVAIIAVSAGHPPNPEMKKLVAEIREKVCSGKTTEAQLNELTKCVEEAKADVPNAEEMSKHAEQCLTEAETDMGFTVDEQNKETVYLICSGKYRMCMQAKLMPAEEAKEPGPPFGGRGRKPDFEKIEKMMDCKRNALEL